MNRLSRLANHSLALLVLLVSPALVAAEPELVTAPYAPDSGSLIVHCGQLIDGVSDRPTQDVYVHIEDGRFAAVSHARPKRPAGVPLLDRSGHTCLPGLIEMHSHMMESHEDLTDLTMHFDDSLEQLMVDGSRYGKATLDSGFTTVRNLGTYYGWAAREMRDAINRGEIVGPRLQVAGFYLTIPGGGGDLLAPDIEPSDIPPKLRQGVASAPEEFAAKAQALVDGGADVIKVIASGAVLAYGGVPGAPEMDLDSLRAVVEVAHGAGLKVAAHAHGAQSIKDSIRAGADTIEHATYIDEEGIALALEHQVALSMDIGPGDWMIEEGRRAGWVEEFLRKTIETTQVQRDNFRRAHAAGVPIVFGSDAGIYPHGMAYIQFPFMVEYGMSPMEAIQAATSVAARYLGWSESVGAVRPGLYGDLVTVPGDPLQDIDQMARVDTVIKGGLLFKAP